VIAVAALFVGLHVAALVADSYARFTLADLAVPLASGWRPRALALGVVATWLLVAVELTSLAMRRLPAVAFIAAVAWALTYRLTRRRWTPPAAGARRGTSWVSRPT
jgi:hypothetical protein